jgi:hypothetical protein
MKRRVQMHFEEEARKGDAGYHVSDVSDVSDIAPMLPFIFFNFLGEREGRGTVENH